MNNVVFGSVVLLALAGAARADLVVNGGFESGFAGWSTAYAVSGSFLSNPSFSGTTHSGAFAAGFGGTEFQDDQLFQTLPTVAGQQYQISFWLRNDAAALDHFRVTWEGGSLLDQSPVPVSSPYGQFTFTVTATTSGSELRFAGYDFVNVIYLDDVSVNAIAAAVPLPASAWIGMGGLAGVAGLGAVRRRRA